MGASLPCDRVRVRDFRGAGAQTLCAPALFIAGIGKCGTNALADHLARHPRVATFHREVTFDPLETPPTALVRFKPTAPNSSRLWIAKHPKYGSADVASLARRLRAAYPNARVALALCNPALLPWRRFLFLLTSALTQHGSGAGTSATFTSLLGALSTLNASIPALFHATFDVRRGCSRAADSNALLDALAARGFDVLYGNAWLRAGPLGEAHCRREWRLAMSHARLLASWTQALGPLNRSVGVVYMEGWAQDGAEYVRSMLRLLGLSADEYPWGSADFASPVFANTRAQSSLSQPSSPSRSSHAPVPAEATSWLEGMMSECALQCHPLERLSGMLPPWCTKRLPNTRARSGKQPSIWAGPRVAGQAGRRLTGSDHDDRCAAFLPPAERRHDTR